jgi:hypothetical protein
MAHPLNKPVRRKSNSLVRERGRLKRIVVTLYPGGAEGSFLGLRLERSRHEATTPLDAGVVAGRQNARCQRAAKRKNRWIKWLFNAV